MTLDGMGKCLGIKGPVSVLSSGVSLRNLGLEVDGSNASHADEKLALKAEPRRNFLCLGLGHEISGLAGQEGLGLSENDRLGTLAARTKQIRTFDIHPPRLVR